MSALITSNSLLQYQATSVFQLLNSDVWLRLFKNDFVPGPANELGDMIEATFPGYAPIHLINLWLAPVKVRNGVYAIRLPEKDFLATSGNGSMVYGFYVSRGPALLCSGRFDTPILVNAVLTIPIVIDFIVGDQSLICS